MSAERAALTPAEVAKLDQGRALLAEQVDIGIRRLRARLAHGELTDTAVFRDMVVEFSQMPQEYCATYLAECLWKLAATNQE